MSDLVVQTPEGLALRYEIAGPGARSAATLIDLLLIALFFALGIGVLSFAPALAEVFLPWILMGFALFLMLYQLICALILQGTTPGKRLLGLVVADEQGFPATYLQHLLRGIFWPLEGILLVPVPLGVVLMAGTGRHQRLGDQVAGTLVLRESTGSPTPEPHAKVRWTELEVRRLALVPAHAARFGVRDTEFLRKLLGRRGVEPFRRARMLRRAAQHYLGVLEFEPPAKLGSKEARAILAELYVFLRHMRERA